VNSERNIITLADMTNQMAIIKMSHYFANI